MAHRLSFTNGTIVPIPNGEVLADADAIFDTPILFGCRSGSCGTCLLKVTAGMENLPAPNRDEQDTLKSMGAGPDCRLACQLTLNGDVTVEYIGK